MQSKSPYKFKKSYGGTPEPQTPQDAPWLRGPSLKITFRFLKSQIAAKITPLCGAHTLRFSDGPYEYNFLTHTISHTNLKIGQVNRQIYKVPHLHDARKWSHSSS